MWEARTLDELHALLGEPTAGRAVALIGGADGLGTGQLEDVGRFFARLVRHLAASGTAVIDGGTDSGVMRLLADARKDQSATFRLIGILPRGVLGRTTRDGSPIDVAPGHEIILVPGERFGDESSWLFDAADFMAAGPAPTIVVNGGDLTLQEARERLEAGCPVIAVAGSGRAADILAAEARPGRWPIRVIPMTANEASIAAALQMAEQE